MKTHEYVKKYNLSAGPVFNHNNFIEDLLLDFFSLLEIGKNSDGKINIKGFENTVRAIRQKFDGISNKTPGGLPEKLWKYFYAAKICGMREQLFPQEMERRRQEKEERYRRQEENRAWENSFGWGAWDNFSSWFFKSNNIKSAIPVDSFTILGLQSTATTEDVRKSYHELARIHHPDMGGQNGKFLEITEAKNKCMLYLSNNTITEISVPASNWS